MSKNPIKPKSGLKPEYYDFEETTLLEDVERERDAEKAKKGKRTQAERE